MRDKLGVLRRETHRKAKERRTGAKRVFNVNDRDNYAFRGI